MTTSSRKTTRGQEQISTTRSSKTMTTLLFQTMLIVLASSPFQDNKNNFVVHAQTLSYSVNCDTGRVNVDFDGAPTSASTSTWIGLYRDSSLPNLPDLPSDDNGNLVDWEYTCGGTRGCNANNLPSSGSVTLNSPSMSSNVRVIFSDDDWTASAQTSVFSVEDECQDNDAGVEEEDAGGDDDDDDDDAEDNGVLGGRVDVPAPALDREPEPEPEPQSSSGRCNPRNTERRRRPWSSLSCSEQDEFLRAVEQLYELGLYQEFTQVHVDMNGQTHRTEAFLPWHRWYLYVFETALQEVSGNCQLAIPYWDWERDAGSEGDSELFDESNFGRFECGGRAGWNDPCTERGMGRGSGGAGGRNFAGEAELLTLITRDSSFADFAPALEGRPHSVVHWFVGGMMSNRRSPTDPLFYLHHASVDRLWTMHQDFHDHDVDIQNGNYLNVHYDGSQNQRLPFPDRTSIDFSWDGDNSNRYPTPRDLLNNVDMRVRYVGDNLAGLLQRDGYSANGRLFEAVGNSRRGCGRRNERDRKLISGGGLRGHNHHDGFLAHQSKNSSSLGRFDFSITLTEEEETKAETDIEMPSFCVGPTPEFTLAKDRQRWVDYCMLLSNPHTAANLNITSAADLFAELAELDCEDIARDNGEPDFDLNFLTELKSSGWVTGLRSGEEEQAFICPRHR
mmetsp:Transcript_27688/g.66695  ORF Transcript_27688/g.66695 Transcript_27688/m.66695 type:complete len:674 (-) Transcript_27688:4103-6124(-)